MVQQYSGGNPTVPVPLQNAWLGNNENETVAEEASVNLALLISGTAEWDDAYAWSLDTAALPPWVRVLPEHSSGNVSASGTHNTLDVPMAGWPRMRIFEN